MRSLTRIAVVAGFALFGACSSNSSGQGGSAGGSGGSTGAGGGSTGAGGATGGSVGVGGGAGGGSGGAAAGSGGAAQGGSGGGGVAGRGSGGSSQTGGTAGGGAGAGGGKAGTGGAAGSNTGGATASGGAGQAGSAGHGRHGWNVGRDDPGLLPHPARRDREPALCHHGERLAAVRRAADQVLARDAGALCACVAGGLGPGDHRGHRQAELQLLHPQPQEPKAVGQQERQHDHLQQRAQLSDPSGRRAGPSLHPARRRGSQPPEARRRQREEHRGLLGGQRPARR